MFTLPERSRTYRNHHLDSTRWDAFRPRHDDIVVATCYKSGTTWTQAIIANLLFPESRFPAPPWTLSPWLDLRLSPLAATIAALDAQQHRRFIKTHLALDGLRFLPQAKYIFVSRDGRDVAMSLWNHYSNLTDEAYALYNDTPGRIGPGMPRAPEDLETFWRDWCTRGWFDWEQDGWPYWSHFSVTQSWWNHRHQPNILLLHYAEMKRDLPGTVRRIADFIGVETTPERLTAVAEATTFEAMKQRGADYAPGGGARWQGGFDTFFHKGANRRWDGAISAEGLALYDEACARVLDPDCRRWMESGGA